MKKIFICLVFSLIMNNAVGVEANNKAEDAYKIGAKYGKKGEYKKAINAYTRALEIDPAHIRSLTTRAITYTKLGKFERSIMDLDKLVKISPTSTSYHIRANVYAQHGHFNRAIVDYNKVLSLDPNYAIGYRNRAMAYSDSKETDKAIIDITKAITLDSNEARWWFDRAMILAKNQEYEKAIKDAETALNLSGNDVQLKPGEMRTVSKIYAESTRLLSDLKRAIKNRDRY